MTKHHLHWKPVRCESFKGGIIHADIPQIIDIHYRGTLLTQILSMPLKNPLSFESAILMINERQKEAYDKGQMSREPGHYQWYSDNFVEWISSLGYHIELNGDEFEAYVLPKRII